jgi:hypothetical protein
MIRRRSKTERHPMICTRLTSLKVLSKGRLCKSILIKSSPIL